MLSWPQFNQTLSQAEELFASEHPKKACSTFPRKDSHLSLVVPLAKTFHETFSNVLWASSMLSLNNCLHPDYTLLHGNISHCSRNKNHKKFIPAHPAKGIWGSECLKVINSAIQLFCCCPFHLTPPPSPPQKKNCYSMRRKLKLTRVIIYRIFSGRSYLS